MNVLPYSFCAAFLALGIAHGQTAYTTPVGYVTMNVPTQSDTTITPSLSQPALLHAASTGISGNQITVAATGAAADAFINASPDPNSKTYLLVRSGALAGLRFPVTANTGTTITVNGGATSLEAQGFVGSRTAPLTGDLVSVIPYWTLNTFFPNGVGLGASSDLVNPIAYVLFSNQDAIGINRAASKLYFYFSGDAENYPDYPAGWYDNDNLDGGLQNTVALDPAVLMTVRNSTAASITVTGEIPSVPLATTLLTSSSGPNDELLGAPYPIDTTLQESGLLSAISPSADLVNPTDYVFVYSDDTTGINKAASKLYFYFSGDAENYPDYPAGWYDNDNLDGGLVTGAVIKAGRCLGIRKASGVDAATRWTAPLPYSL